jgi:Spy/CpxP family protein refolding chaperone
MVRFSSKFLAVIAAVAVVAMAAQLAVAQNEQGKRGPGGRGGGPGGPGGRGGPPSMARLAMIDKVQDELKLTDEQKTKIEKINSDFRKEMSGDRPDPEKMKKMRDGVTDKLKEVLNADQQKRLMGIFIQVMGSGAVMDPAVGKEIDLTDEQQDKLHEAMGPPPEGREGRGGGQSFQERRAKMDKEIAAVLTPEQQKKLESLKGEKVEIDMSALRGPGGGREGRGRDRGNRGEPKASKSSS